MEIDDENAAASFVMCLLFVNNLTYCGMLCFVKKVLERIEEGVDRFLNGSANELYRLKAGK